MPRGPENTGMFFITSTFVLVSLSSRRRPGQPEVLPQLRNDRDRQQGYAGRRCDDQHFHGSRRNHLHRPDHEGPTAAAARRSTELPTPRSRSRIAFRNHSRQLRCSIWPPDDGHHNWFQEIQYHVRIKPAPPRAVIEIFCVYVVGGSGIGVVRLGFSHLKYWGNLKTYGQGSNPKNPSKTA